MNDQASTDFALIDLTKMPLEPAKLFAPGGAAKLLERLEAEARSIAPDISTAKGRKAIASTAARVARSKTCLDGLGKTLNAELKKQTAAVDAERRTVRERLDALRDEVRQQQEAGRQQAIRERINAMSAELPRTSAELARRIVELEATRIDESWQEFAADAARAKDTAMMHARAALAEIQEREQAEAERRVVEEKARLEREEQIRQEAAAKARAEAERAAEEALAKFRREQEQKTAEEAKRRREEKKQSQDREYREQINRDIAAELVFCTGISTDQAHAVVVAIVRGQIPHVSISY